MRNATALATSVLAAALLAGCSQENPVEEAGEHLDEPIQPLGNAPEEAANALDEAARTAREAREAAEAEAEGTQEKLDPEGA